MSLTPDSVSYQALSYHIITIFLSYDSIIKCFAPPKETTFEQLVNFLLGLNHERSTALDISDAKILRMKQARLPKWSLVSYNQMAEKAISRLQLRWPLLPRRIATNRLFSIYTVVSKTETLTQRQLSVLHALCGRYPPCWKHRVVRRSRIGRSLALGDVVNNKKEHIDS